MLFQKRKPLGFRKWIDLENHKQLIAKAVEGSDFPEQVIAYLSTAFGSKRWDKKPWKTLVFSMVDGFEKFSPDRSLPILNTPKNSKKTDWEYEGRTWHRMSHLLSDSYGWTLEYIAEMDVNEALGHVQEILTQDYLDKEFNRSLSEVCYEYNKSTKKSTFRASPVPYWMRPPSKPIKRFRIKRSLLPVGNVIDVSGMAEQVGLGSILTKEENVDTPRDSSPVPPPS